MRSPTSFAIAAAVVTACLLGCGRSTPTQPYDAALVARGAEGGAPAAGGATVATSPPSVGGVPGAGGIGVGGIPGSGAAIGVGGEPATGGRLGTGGVTGLGGTSSAGGAGGASGLGGTVVRRDGGSAAGGTAGLGGTLATGGTVGAGGTTSSAGNSGSGGATGPGGATGSGGASGPPLPPRFFGNVDTRNEVRSDFATYWDQFTPENVGKWAWVQGSSANTFSWERLDAVYKYCEDNHIIFKEHSFIWGLAQAPWINNNNAVEAVQTWMKAFCDRYPKTRLIDVVDEPLHSTPAYATGIGGGSRTTWDWVANSFKWAREACPNAILILSDYNIIEYSSERGRIIELAKTILAAGAPVMALGAQGHDVAQVPLSTVQSAIAEIFSQTGLPVYITQLDLPVADDAKQATMMKDFVTTFWDDPRVPGFTYWGYVNGATWRANTGLISSDGTQRPAMTWLLDFLGR